MRPIPPIIDYWLKAPVTEKNEAWITVAAFAVVAPCMALFFLAVIAFLAWDTSWFTWRAFRILLVINAAILLISNATNDKDKEP